MIKFLRLVWRIITGRTQLLVGGWRIDYDHMVIEGNLVWRVTISNKRKGSDRITFFRPASSNPDKEEILYLKMEAKRKVEIHGSKNS